jgi:hypothetical protein
MISYFPVVTGSLSVSGSVNISGGITASGGISISGSIASASYAATAATASSADNFLTRGTLTAQTLVVQTITSSVDFVTGSTRFGSLLANTHVFSGSVTMNPGGLFVSGSGLVGIGINSPKEKLEIEGLFGNIRIYGRGGVSNNVISSNLYYDGTNWLHDNASYGAAQIVLSAQSGVIIFGTTSATTGDATEKMRLLSSGNLGINTSTAGATLPSGPGWTTQPTRVRVLQINSTDGYANAGLFLRQTDESTGLDLWSDNYYGDVYIDSRWNNVAGNMYFRLKTSSTAIIPLTITARGQFIASYGQTGGYNRTDSGYVNETINITANCTAYFLYKYSGAGNGSSSTNFNITGVSTTNGTWLDVCIRARKDATGNAINTTAVFQINGSTIDSIAASGTGAQQRDKTLRVVRMSDEWIVVGTPYTV